MLLIPYKIDVSSDRQPYANYAIISCNVLIFCWILVSKYKQELHGWSCFILQGWSIEGLLGYMWLHDEYFHVISNMIFLWLFGNAVCSKLGNIWYGCLYIAGGVLSVIVHLLFDGRPAMGASGAISAVLGMYFVLHPYLRIKRKSLLAVFIFPLRYFRTVGLWLILFFWFVLDLLGVLIGYTLEAYWTHVGGFIIGVLFGIILLRAKVIKRDDPQGSF